MRGPYLESKLPRYYRPHLYILCLMHAIRQGRGAFCLGSIGHFPNHELTRFSYHADRAENTKVLRNIKASISLSTLSPENRLGVEVQGSGSKKYKYVMNLSLELTARQYQDSVPQLALERARL